ncbi:MAG: alcohol dehydrogenase catalytic domain-containing protein [Chlorobia bacterium]|nr:alcohol dehydrogenase catalytic domain-containing protein [Fimbriimonadaceae bacterium]
MITAEALPSTIRAAVLEAPGRIVVQDIPMWPLESYGDPDLILLKVEACGVCGSDFRYFAGENPWAQHTLGKFVPNPPNIVLGHEFAGTVVAVQSEKNRHLLGKRVAPICSKVCGACDECRSGRSRLCPNTVHLGHGQGWGEQDFFPGAYSHYVPAWGSSCYEISDSLSFSEAAMMDILAVCVHVAETGCVQPGRPILCIGAGPAGNGIAQAALALGASQAVLVDRSQVALNVARAQSLGVAIDASGRTDEQVLGELTSVAPDGFGTVFDSVGTSSTLNLGLQVLGKSGTLVNLAVHDEPIEFNFMRLSGERKITTSCNFEVGDYPTALAWLEEGRFRVKEWLTPISIEEIPARFEEVVGSPGDKAVFKMVVQ